MKSNFSINLISSYTFNIFNFYIFEFFNNFFFFFKKKNINFFFKKNFDFFFFKKINNIYYEISYINFNNITLNKNVLINFYFNSFNFNFFSFFSFFSFLFSIIFFFFYFFFFEKKNFYFFRLLNDFILVWIKFLIEKLESFEESFLFFKFLLFFLFLFFLHFFFFDNFLNTYIFLEWSLPVIFGLFIILENIWLFSSSIFIYLNGSKGRKFFFITLVEDFINLFILITRILLQIIRGVICSLYHDFFREISILFFFKIYNFFFF